jgi:hypothetical protein
VRREQIISELISDNTALHDQTERLGSELASAHKLLSDEIDGFKKELTSAHESFQVEIEKQNKLLSDERNRFATELKSTRQSFHVEIEKQTKLLSDERNSFATELTSTREEFQAELTLAVRTCNKKLQEQGKMFIDQVNEFKKECMNAAAEESQKCTTSSKDWRSLNEAQASLLSGARAAKNSAEPLWRNHCVPHREMRWKCPRSPRRRNYCGQHGKGVAVACSRFDEQFCFLLGKRGQSVDLLQFQGHGDLADALFDSHTF